MKNLLLKAVSIAVLVSCANFADAGVMKVDRKLEANLVKICKAIQSNSRVRFIRALEYAGLSYRNVEKGLVCNGMNVLAFAQYNDSEKLSSYMLSRTKYPSEVRITKR